MPIETPTAAVAAALKFFLPPATAGIAATALAFMFLWPRTLKEAFVRIACTIITSALLGPALVIAVHAWKPGLFDSARLVARLYGDDPALGVFFIAAPLMAAAGLPAWWFLGAIVRWFDKRRGMDIGEMAADAAAGAKKVKEAVL